MQFDFFSDDNDIIMVSHVIFIHIFSQPNDEQYISVERQSTIEALHKLL